MSEYRSTTPKQPAPHALAVLALSFTCLNATAQEIRPPGDTFRELQQKPESELPRERPTIDIAPQPKRAVKAIPGLSVDVKAFRFSGLTVVDESQLQAVVQRFTGPAKNFEDLQAAADAASESLQQQGYFVAQVYLPEQKLENGVVELAVLEGRLGEVRAEIADNVPVSRSMIEGLLSTLRPGMVMQRDSVERALFLVSDLRGMKVRSVVEPGAAPGTANLVVQVQPGRRFEGSIEYDNHGSRFIGETRAGLGLTINSPLHRGDLLSFRALASVPGGGASMKFARLAYLTPIGDYGTKVGAAFSHLEYHLGTNTFTLLDQGGTADVYSAFALHPLVRGRNFNIFGQASYDFRDFHDDRRGISLTSDRRTTVGSLGFVGDSRDVMLGGGINNFSLTYTPGRLELQTPSDLAADQAPTGRRAAGQYWRLNGTFSRLNGVTQNSVIYATYSFQIASKNLDASEKLGLGGPTAVRGYAVGEATSDEWQLFSTEYRVNIPQKELPGTFTVAAFYDWARGDANRLPQPAEIRTNTRTLQAAGFGLTWARQDDFLVRFSLAWRLTGSPISDPIDRKPRLYFQLQKNL